jgi:hypothetical protein
MGFPSLPGGCPPGAMRPVHPTHQRMSALTMNPFQQLVDLAEKPSQTPAPAKSHLHPAVANEAHGPTAALLFLLDCNGPMTSAQLAAAIDRSTNIVHGLLKSRRKQGVVRLEDGVWSLNRDVHAAEQNAVTVAVELLTSLGWTVVAPEGVVR